MESDLLFFGIIFVCLGGGGAFAIGHHILSKKEKRLRPMHPAAITGGFLDTARKPFRPDYFVLIFVLVTGTIVILGRNDIPPLALVGITIFLLLIYCITRHFCLPPKNQRHPMSLLTAGERLETRNSL